MTEDVLTTSEVQSLLNLGSPAAARVQLRRWGIAAVGRNLDGQKTWPADKVKAKAETRAGQGARTDLARP